MLVPSMRDTVFEPSVDGLSDAMADIAEVALDAVLQDGLIRELPVVGSILAMCKTGAGIRERNFIRQTAVFIKSFNDGLISPNQLQAHRKKLEDDPKEAERELGRVMLLLDRTIEAEQSRVLGKFYGSYVKGALSWAKFVELSEVNWRMFLEDYGELLQIGARPIGQDASISERREYRIRRLESLGLVIERRAKLFDGNVLESPTSEYGFFVTPLGDTLYKLMS
jgi:hypothetical protein